MDSLLLYLHTVNTFLMKPAKIKEIQLIIAAQQLDFTFMFFSDGHIRRLALLFVATSARHKLLIRPSLNNLDLLSRRAAQFVFLWRRFLSLWLLVELVFLYREKQTKWVWISNEGHDRRVTSHLIHALFDPISRGRKVNVFCII